MPYKNSFEDKDLFEKYKNVDINDLVDIRDVNIDAKLSKEEKLKSYIEQIKNPNCYKYDKYKIITTYNTDENAPTLESCLKTYFENL